MMVFLLSCFETHSPTTQPRPDVLLVVLDTTRSDALISYGNNRPVGESFQKIAEKGVLFQNAWAPASWTWPSHASLFTGLYPWEHGAHFAPKGEAIALKPDPFYASNISDNVITLAERLQKEGYDTAAFSANRLLGPDFQLTRGFAINKFLDDDSKVVQQVSDYLQERKRSAQKKPLFLFINLMSAHTPWFRNDVPWIREHEQELTPETASEWLRPHLLPNGIGLHPFYPNFSESLVYEYLTHKKDIPPDGVTLIRDLYESEVQRSDIHLGMIYDKWDNPNSIVAVTSDHGEYLTEHHLLEHGRTLYPEVLHVPLVIASPNLNKGTVESPVPMHILHDEILKQLQLPSKHSLFDSFESIYAAAWEDEYWSSALGYPFDRGYRVKRTRENVFILDSQGTCTSYKLTTKSLTETNISCSKETISELADLFTNSKTGKNASPSKETLEQLKQLGYVGEEKEKASSP